MTEQTLSMNPGLVKIGRFACFGFALVGLLGSYWGAGIVLGPAAFLLAVYLTSRKKHPLSDAGGLIGLVAFAISLGLAVPRLAANSKAENPWIGKEAPDFELTDLQGNRHRLSAYRGKRVFVTQWGTRCPPCIYEIPYLNALAQEMPREKFQILSVSADPQMWLEKTVEKAGIDYPVVTLSSPDNRWGEPYSLISFLPTLMVVSPEGRFEAIYEGGLPKELLEKLARGESL